MTKMDRAMINLGTELVKMSNFVVENTTTEPNTGTGCMRRLNFKGGAVQVLVLQDNPELLAAIYKVVAKTLHFQWITLPTNPKVQ